MNLQELGINILNIMIANIPYMVFLFTELFKMKKKVNDFDFKVNVSEKNILEKVEKKVNNLLEFTEDKISKTIDKVDATINDINLKVDGFSKQIETLNLNYEHIVKENKIAFEIIATLIGENSEYVKNGVAKIVVDKVNMTQKELQEYPELISSDLEAFKNALIEQEKLLGRDNLKLIIEQTIKGFGYDKERKDKKL